MSDKVKLYVLVKPDGTKVKVNDNSLEYALSIGWKKQKNSKKEDKE